ncbi:hypothetical protein AAVH_05811 [Aphelenchoides avenae]|nr:hypothetical protein AAVH_05811 [Aphelenchus avenae]
MVSARKSQVSDSDVRAVLEDPDLEFDVADDNALLLPEDDPHKDLIDEIKKNIESEEADCMESEKLLLDVRTKYSSQMQALNATIVKASRSAVCFLCGDAYEDEDRLRSHMAVVHLGQKTDQWKSGTPNEMPPTADDYR